jgi:hypothetical protein
MKSKNQQENRKTKEERWGGRDAFTYKGHEVKTI